ncbi:hypothetical protein G3576_22325 [Roseomonas stagni]|uniref:Esterase-like activity of phytase family protein n=1 Tax=Falsiroseomonas algicola TaxID=2716930 RepID=A0A6M1LQT4_9PROT|nr:DUF6454 family protein [Falsiroseomonas algicola]NGM22766.1 hypothetical protein [Falsiroseomonas algicola]
MQRILRLALMALSLAGPAAAQERGIPDRLAALSRGAAWQPAGVIPLAFPTHHPQGMARIGDRFYLSSVEIITRTERFPEPRDGLDRTPGEGRGHLFEVDAEGRLLRSVTLGEGSIYHPGGIDFDGTHLWVPVAEYRPNSRSIIYRVDPATMQAEAVFRFGDHVGGLVMDRASATLHGVSWGSRRFYAWPLDGAGRPTNLATAPEALRRANPSHYIDYQDCHSVGPGLALCSGLNAYRPRGPQGPVFALGGVELVDLARGAPVFQLPVEHWTESGLPMTQNPFAVAAQGANGLRFWFAPEDDRTRIFVFDVMPR